MEWCVAEQFWSDLPVNHTLQIKCQYQKTFTVCNYAIQSPFYQILILYYGHLQGQQMFTDCYHLAIVKEPVDSLRHKIVLFSMGRGGNQSKSIISS